MLKKASRNKDADVPDVRADIQGGQWTDSPKGSGACWLPQNRER